MSIASKIKATAVGAGLTLATVFGSVETAEAQSVARSSASVNRSAAVINRTAPKAATTVLANDFEKTTTAKPANESAPVNSALEPAIREGGFGKALGHSGRNQIMTVQISGKSLEQLKIDAQEIHENFRKAKIPTDVVVFYNVNERLNVPLGSIAMNGDEFELPTVGSNLPVKDIKERTDLLAQYYHKYYGTASANTAVNTKPELVSN